MERGQKRKRLRERSFEEEEVRCGAGREGVGFRHQSLIGDKAQGARLLVKGII